MSSRSEFPRVLALWTGGGREGMVHACHPFHGKWSAQVNGDARVSMLTTPSMAWLQMAQGLVVSCSPGAGDPCP